MVRLTGSVCAAGEMFARRSRFLFPVNLVFILLFVEMTSAFQTSEHCSWETFTVQCPGDQVILIQSAFYGRMEAKRCISGNYAESMGCRADVSSYLDEHCSGRVNCSMLVATIDSLKQPCPKDFKPYLEINYECAKVSFVDDCRHGNATRLSDELGYLALYRNPFGNRAADQRHLPGYCPWVLSADSGKRFHLTWKVNRPQPGRDSVKNEVEVQGSCHVGLIFRDGSDESLTSGPCLTQSVGDDSSDGVFTSREDRLEVHLALDTGSGGDQTIDWTSSGAQNPTNPLPPFIIQYKAFGCSNVVAPDGTTVTRDGDVATVACVDSQETWYVRCQDGEWVGAMENCTRKAVNSLPKSTTTTQHSYDELKHGIVVAISIGVVLGVVVGAVMMMIIFIAKKSRHRFGEGPRASPASPGLYELRASKACRCPALYVPEVPQSDIGLPPLYEYTYACRTVSSSAADTISRLELDKGTGVLASSNCTPCSVKCAEIPEADDDEDADRKGRVVPVGIYELTRPRPPPIGQNISQESDLRCTCKQNLTLISRFGVESPHLVGRPFALQHRPS